MIVKNNKICVDKLLVHCQKRSLAMKIILSLLLLLTNLALAESFNSRGDGHYVYSNKFNNRPLSQKGPGFVDLVKGRFTPIQTDENKKTEENGQTVE